MSNVVLALNGDATALVAGKPLMHYFPWKHGGQMRFAFVARKRVNEEAVGASVAFANSEGGVQVMLTQEQIAAVGAAALPAGEYALYDLTNERQMLVPVGYEKAKPDGKRRLEHATARVTVSIEADGSEEAGKYVDIAGGEL